MFRLNAPVVIRAKVKEVRNNIAIYSDTYTLPRYTSLEVKGRWGLLLPPCLLITAVQQPGASSPPSRLKRSSTGVIWMCKASFTNNSWSSAMVQYGGLLPVDQVVVLPCVFRYSWLLHHPPLAGISVFFQPHLQSPFGLSNVDLAAAAGYCTYVIGISKGAGIGAVDRGAKTTML